MTVDLDRLADEIRAATEAVGEPGQYVDRSCSDILALGPRWSLVIHEGHINLVSGRPVPATAWAALDVLRNADHPAPPEPVS